MNVIKCQNKQLSVMYSEEWGGQDQHCRRHHRVQPRRTGRIQAGGREEAATKTNLACHLETQRKLATYCIMDQRSLAMKGLDNTENKIL